ncbi:MAG TPA: SxtJ family membrane protein [Pyrinomonadaceae bacterium]|nr:SxtJ family membrane protein [Pyrinomonadaceae bacterium]
MSPVKPHPFRAEREFGVLVGGVLLALRLWWWYRGKFEIAGFVLTLIGSALVVFGAFAPRLLVTPRKLWMKLAEAMAYVSSRIILAIVFFLVLTPIGLVKRAMGWDPLQRRAGSRDSFWQPYPERQRNTRHYEKMY